jgi:hypothetical protein
MRSPDIPEFSSAEEVPRAELTMPAHRRIEDGTVREALIASIETL